MGFSFLKPGAYVDHGPMGEWAEQNGGGKKHWQNSKASPFVFIFFLFAFRTTGELTVWICLSLLNWCNTDNDRGSVFSGHPSNLHNVWNLTFSMNVAWYVTEQFQKCLNDICFNIGAENPWKPLGSTVLYSSKTIEEKPTIAFVTDLLASEQLSAIMLA